MIQKLINKWDHFFFDPRPVESIALFRILWSVILLIYYFIELGNVTSFYSPEGLISLKTAELGMNYPHVGLFQFLPEGISSVYVLLVIYFLGLMGSLVGFYTRSSLFIVFICMISFHQRNIWILNSAEVLMRFVTLYLIFSPSGFAFSVDAKRKSYPKEWSPWALRLLQLQLSVVYLWTFWHKIGGSDWVDGTAVYYATRLTNFRMMTIPFLLDSILLIKVYTWVTLALEFCLGAFLWVKEFRIGLIIMGLLFHLSLQLILDIPFFQIIMMALLLLFVQPEEVRALIQRFRKA